MNKKKFALKGLLALFVVIALCMFFSRTVQTITTPKVQRISATKGKLEQKISLSGEIHFPVTEEIKIDNAKKLSIKVEELMVRPGYFVKAGDPIFTAYAPDYDSKYEELQKKYDDKVTEYAEHIASNLRAKQSSAQNDLYTDMLEKIDLFFAARYALVAQAAQDNYTLPEDETLWLDIADGTDALNSLSASLKTAAAEKDAAVKALTAVYNGTSNVYRIGDSTFEYIKKKESLEKEIDQYSQDLIAFAALQQSLLTITAPHDGYITAIDLKVGDSYDGSTAAFKITPADSVPVLRADVTNVDKTLREKLKVVLTQTDTESEIESLETSGDGKKYALITLSSKVLKSAGGLTHLLSESSIPLTITYKAQKSTTLLPASAVRSDGSGSYYVYVVQQNYGGGLLGSGGYTLSKTPVTVIESSDQIVALEDDLSYREIADREDRALSDGQAVMDYVN